ncbi:MAG TPA: VWA domain-containing protein [Candidatus Limnocylindria bacterium]|jgi:Ca-activated chloride channel family protein|nr:VWA domain-containing protein [Candidatus Limnocylindria bacterium]
MTFQFPLALWLVLTVPILAALYVWAQRRRQKYALRYASLSLVREALGRGPGIRRHIPPALFLAAIFFMTVALARPVTVVTVPAQEGTVILAIDVSGSMQAEDLKPNRMEAAKEAAKAFVLRQGEDVKVGIVSFSGDASLVQSPTTDRQLVVQAINRLRPQRATAIGRGILTSLDAIFENDEEIPPSVQALQRLEQSGGQQRPAATPPPGGTLNAPATIILLSDGQNNQFPAPLQIIDAAISRGIRVYTVGVGSAEGTILRLQGRAIRTRLDEATLKQIAELTDAEYFNASSEKDLRAVYEHLSTQLVLRQQKTEVTAYLTAIAAVLSIIAGALSLFWFNRLP